MKRLLLLLLLSLSLGCNDKKTNTSPSPYTLSAHDRGLMAYKAGVAVTDNPYDSDRWQSERSAWQNGWVQAKLEHDKIKP